MFYGGGFRGCERPSRRVLSRLAVLALPGLATACVSPPSCFRCESELTGAGEVRQAIGPSVPFHTSFSLGYVTHDRPVARFGMGADGRGNYVIALADDDGTEAISGRSSWYDFRHYLSNFRTFHGLPADSDVAVHRTVSQSGCRGTCSISIPGSDNPNYEFVLTGFDLEFERGARNLRTVQVWHPGSLSRTMLVTLRDDGAGNAFTVRVSYALIPSEWIDTAAIVDDCTSVSAYVYPRGQFDVALEHWPAGARTLVAGFRLSYVDGDEHLLRIGVDATQAGRLRGELRDNDGVERICREVKLLALCRDAPSDNAVIPPCR